MRCAPEKNAFNFSSFRSTILVQLVSLLIILLTSCTVSDVSLPTSTPSPTQVATPTEALLPDLIAIQMSFEPENPGTCFSSLNPLGTRVLIANTGPIASDSFTVSLNGVQQYVDGGLSSGDTISLWFVGYAEQNTLIVDDLQQIREGDESNNRLSAPFTPPELPQECQPTPPPATQALSAIAVLKGHTGKVWGVDFSPDGRLLASASTDNTLRLWRVSGYTLLRTMQGHPFPILCVSFSPNNQFIATGSDDSIVRIWRVSNAELMHSLTGHGGWVNALAYSPDGNILATASDDYTVRMWRASDGRELRVIDEGMSRVLSIAYSPNGTSLAWSESDGHVRVWQISGGKWLFTTQPSQQSAESIAISPDGELLVVGFADGTIW